MFDDDIILDVRSQEEYNKEHVAGAICIPHLAISKSDQLPSDKNQNIILYCHQGKRAEMAKRFLETIGYTQVTNLGGLNEVLELGFKLGD